MLVVLGARQRSFALLRMTRCIRMTKPREDNHRPFKNLLKAIFITIISRFYDSLAVIHPVQEKRKEHIPGYKEDAR